MCKGLQSQPPAYGRSSCLEEALYPAQASVTCAATGPISVPDLSRIRGSEGREVFSERKGLSLFKNKVLSLNTRCPGSQGVHACPIQHFCRSCCLAGSPVAHVCPLARQKLTQYESV